MSTLLRAALIGAALLTSTSVFALEGIDGDANPVPNVESYPGYSGGYAYEAPWNRPGVSPRALTRAERRALSRGQEIR